MALCCHAPGSDRCAQAHAARRSPVIIALSVPIYCYRWLISPLIGPRCRFLPTCSEYALEALAVHGPVRGLWFATKRLARCHPWGGSGFDPVPPVSNKHRTQ